MVLTCKKISMILSIILLFLPIANAANIKVAKFSMPVKLSNKISQPVFVNFSSGGNWRIIAEALDSQIRNTDNPNYNLPINRLEIAELNGTPITNFDVGKSCELRSATVANTNNLNLALNAVSFEGDYPGNYVADVKFTLLENNSVMAEDIYTFRFVQDAIAAIDFPRRNLLITMNCEDIANKNNSQSFEIPSEVYVSSNKNWKLYVSSPSNHENSQLQYFIKILNSSDQSIEYKQKNEYIPLKKDPVLLASGNLTVNKMANNLEKKLINVDYMVKGPEDDYIPAGSFVEEIEYKLEMED